MDKIQEKFNKITDLGYFFESESQVFAVFKAGYKSADLLPTEKVCPECEGSGWRLNQAPHQVMCDCKNGTIPLYYTPEQYEKIMGKPYPDDALCWGRMFDTESYTVQPNLWWKGLLILGPCQKSIVIVQTAQPPPTPDYRPEEI